MDSWFGKGFGSARQGSSVRVDSHDQLCTLVLVAHKLKGEGGQKNLFSYRSKETSKQCLTFFTEGKAISSQGWPAPAVFPMTAGITFSSSSTDWSSAEGNTFLTWIITFL